MFNELFEAWAGGAFPLAVAKRMCTARFGVTFDERVVAVEVVPYMRFPPEWSAHFLRAGLAPQLEGPVLQAVRLRRSTRSAA